MTISSACNVRLGSKCEELNLNKSCPLCPTKQTSMRAAVTSLMGHNWTDAESKRRLYSIP
ncbi:hypothetical protein ABIB95_005777 [Bradyrhizobium sp. LA2.1]